MELVVAPEEKKVGYGKKSLFIAGGITGCPDWQSDVIEELQEEDYDDLIVYNPRRDKFDVNDKWVAKRQIEWEYNYLSESIAIMWWFPKESVCPIALYELGKWADNFNTEAFVGVHEEYPRRLDVEEQLKHSVVETNIRYSLEGLMKDVKNWCEKY